MISANINKPFPENITVQSVTGDPLGDPLASVISQVIKNATEDSLWVYSQCGPLEEI